MKSRYKSIAAKSSVCLIKNPHIYLYNIYIYICIHHLHSSRLTKQGFFFLKIQSSCGMLTEQLVLFLYFLVHCCNQGFVLELEAIAWILGLGNSCIDA